MLYKDNYCIHFKTVDKQHKVATVLLQLSKLVSVSITQCHDWLAYGRIILYNQFTQMFRIYVIHIIMYGIKIIKYEIFTGMYEIFICFVRIADTICFVLTLFLCTVKINFFNQYMWHDILKRIGCDKVYDLYKTDAHCFNAVIVNSRKKAIDKIS